MAEQFPSLIFLHIKLSKIGRASAFKRDISWMAWGGLVGYVFSTHFSESQGSLVSIEIKLGVGRLGFNSRQGQLCDIFPSPSRPHWYWGPPSLLYSGYRGLLPRGWSGRGAKLTTHLHLVPRLRMSGAIPPLTQ